MRQVVPLNQPAGQNSLPVESVSTMNIARTSPIHLLLTVACVWLSGCTSAGLNLSLKSEKFDKETPQNPVEQIVPVWQEGEGAGVERNQYSRGFSGQIYFITQRRGLPSEVNGRVRIYVFDDQGSPEEQAKPIHQFDFEPEAWKAHLTTSKLGPAYSVFIPYTRKGHNMAECALRIRYTPLTGPADKQVEGTPVFSQMVTLVLGGAKKPADYETVVSPEAKPKQPEQTSAMPEVSPRGRSGRSIDKRVQQVAANGDLVQRSGLQTADFETPAGRQRDQGRIRKADYETYTDEDHQNPTRKVVGDENLDFLGEVDDAEEIPVRRSEPRRIRDTRRTAEPARVDDEPPKLRTYTIPLGD